MDRILAYRHTQRVGIMFFHSDWQPVTRTPGIHPGPHALQNLHKKPGGSPSLLMTPSEVNMSEERAL